MTHVVAGSRTALVVDDDRSTRLPACAVLSRLGVEAREAGSGEQALDILAIDEIDLILLDVEMPGMDGFETCLAIRNLARGAHVPIVMLTSHDEIESVRRAFEVGATDFVMKPVNWLVLEQRLGYVLRASDTARELHAKQAALDLAQDMARLGSFSWDPSSGFVTGSANFLRLYHFPQTAEGIEIEDVFERILDRDRSAVLTAFESCLAKREPISVDHRLALSGSSPRTMHIEAHALDDGDSDSLRVEGIAQDITERKEHEEQIRYLAFHDPLTGVGNLRAFRDKLSETLVLARRRDAIVALLFVDLDRFKRINDTYGHRAGDEVLREIARRLSSAVRESDVVGRLDEPTDANRISRLGGDEFTILLTELRDARDAGLVARRILAALAEPIDIDVTRVHVGASIGISIFPFDAKDEEALRRAADAAMYHAKALDDGSFQYYDESMNGDSARRMMLESRMRVALPAGQVTVHYQPKLSLQTHEITGVEALARWFDPDDGFVPPDQFIPVAEECGLITSLTELVLDKACRDVKSWHDKGLGAISLAVNLSPCQLSDADLPELIDRALERSGLDPCFLEVEITESALIRDDRTTEQILSRLAERGIRIALDDFGTGYSSLTYLKRFPVNTVKIDRSFVKDLELDASSAALARAIVLMGHALDLTTIAEGVETEAQRRMLADLCCDEEQGYRFSPPIPADQLETMLAGRLVSCRRATAPPRSEE